MKTPYLKTPFTCNVKGSASKNIAHPRFISSWRLNPNSQTISVVSKTILVFAFSISLLSQVSLGQTQEDTFLGFSGNYAWPRLTFGDIDNDGDVDALIGTSSGSLALYRNEGSPELPRWRLEDDDHIPRISEGRAAPRFVDLDNDGDLDVVAGNGVSGCGGGTLYQYENTGSPAEAEWALVTKKMGGIDRCDNSTPAFGDLNGDGLVDMIVGGGRGELSYYVQTGSTDSLAWQKRSLNISINTGWKSAPTLYDIDADGDLDLFSGNDRGQLWYYENIGDADSLHFALVTSRYAGVSWGHVSYSFPIFVDIDADGDGDLYVGRDNSEIYFFCNEGTSESPVWSEPKPAHVSTDDETYDLNSMLHIDAYPNPAIEHTTIRLSIEEPTMVSIKLYDILGRSVRDIANRWYAIGMHEFRIDVNDLSAGVYFLRTQSEDQVDTVLLSKQ